MRSFCLTILLAVPLAVGCGDDKKGPTMAACNAYCSCMVAQCSAVMQTTGTQNFVPGGTMSACVSTCLQHAEWDLACRTEHCNNAVAMPTNDYRLIHCPHAVGMANTCLPP